MSQVLRVQGLPPLAYCRHEAGSKASVARSTPGTSSRICLVRDVFFFTIKFVESPLGKKITFWIGVRQKIDFCDLEL